LNRPDHQLRVENEKFELDVKLGVLLLDIKSSDFNLLPMDEQDRLRRQHVAMHEYSAVLGERIAAFVTGCDL
jgi:hypothetical protein